MRPQTLDRIVGQTKAKEVIRTLIKSSETTGKPLPHLLFSAASGTGKTTFAQAIAHEMKVNFLAANCATIGKADNLFEIISEVSPGSILFLDEIHGLSKKCCESLYTVMEDFCYYDSGFKMTLPEFTLIGASTEIGSLPPPLKSRFKFTANLVPYTEDELVKVCKMVCEEQKFKLDDNVAKLIAKTTRGIPRNMVSRAEWIRHFMIGNQLKSIKPKEVLEIIKLQGVNEDGLEEHDIKYLKILFHERKGISLDSLSSKMNTSKENIAKIIEPYLIEKGFVQKSAGRGRSLTKEGIKYVTSL